MILFHGTSRKNLDSIRSHGIRMTRNEVWPDESVCALDSLRKAKSVAAYFGKDGVVIEFEVPDELVLFHPDYGHGIQFDTVHVTENVPVSSIRKIIDAPSSLSDDDVRPIGPSLRKWKTSRLHDSEFMKRLDSVFNIDDDD